MARKCKIGISYIEQQILEVLEFGRGAQPTISLIDGVHCFDDQYRVLE